VFPSPAAVVYTWNLDPRAKSYFALEDLLGLLLTHGVLAARPVVGRDLYNVGSARQIFFVKLEHLQRFDIPMRY
jgi:hypothetical protein